MIWVIRLLPAAAALVCIVLGLLPQRRGVSHPVMTEGTVIGSRRQRIPQRRGEIEVFAPVVCYATPDGEIEAVSRDFVPEWQYDHHPGDLVQLCYDAQQPDVFRLTKGGTWRRVICLTIGIGTLIAYGVLLVQYNTIL